MSEDIRNIEEHRFEKAYDMHDINRARGEEVARLGLDAAALKEQMQEPEDALLCACGCGGDPSLGFGEVFFSEEDHRLNEALSRRRAQLDDLQRQVEEQSAELAKVREQSYEAQKEAAMQEAKLGILRDMHQQEVTELRRHLSLEQAASGADEAFGQAVSGLGDGLEASVLALNSARRLDLASRLRMEEACKLLEIEIRLHRDEMEAIIVESETTAALIEAARAAAGDEGFFEAPSSAVVRQGESSRQGLRRRCEELCRPTKLFFAELGRPALPEVPTSDRELGLWLQNLSSQLSQCVDDPCALEHRSA